MFYLPLTASPLGWVILGAGGYALYKVGKKKGQDEAAASRITEVPDTPNTPGTESTPGTEDKAKTTAKGEK